MEKSKLEEILQEPIKDLKIGPGSQPGDNVAGSLLAFKVQTASNRQIHLVHKSLADDAMGKDFAIKNQSFHVEHAFYSALVPALESFAKHKKYSSGHPTLLPLPKFYSGFVNDCDDYLLLEDIRANGYKMCDKYIGYTLEEVNLILKELAVFHALTHAYIKWEGEQLFEKDELKVFNKSLLNDPEFQAYGLGLFNGAYENSIELIRERDEGLAEKMKKLDCNTLEKVFDTTMNTDKTYFPCFIYGDVWTNNIMLKYDPSTGHPTAVKFLDFQLTRRANLFEELKYFIYTSTTPAFRKRNLNQVLSVYYNSFKTTMEALSSPMPIGFSLGFFIDHFYGSIPSMYKYLSFAIALQLGDPEAGKPKGPPPEGNSNGHGHGPPGPELNGQSSPTEAIDMMGEMQLKMFVAGLVLNMRARPKAIDRLYDVTLEMVELNIL